MKAHASKGAYLRILVAVDGSAASGKGLREAIRLAQKERAELVIMHVVNDFFPSYRAMLVDVHQQMQKQAKEILAKAQTLAHREGVEAQTILRKAFSGGAAPAIVREAKKQRADLIVLGTHGRRGMVRLVLGSDAEEVARNAPVPVLLVRAGA
jgi:nucleotide-binding universal stress UspA family protein